MPCKACWLGRQYRRQWTRRSHTGRGALQVQLAGKEFAVTGCCRSILLTSSDSMLASHNLKLPTVDALYMNQYHNLTCPHRNHVSTIGAAACAELYFRLGFAEASCRSQKVTGSHLKIAKQTQTTSGAAFRDIFASPLR